MISKLCLSVPLSKVLTQNLHNIKAIYVTDVSILSNLCICLSDAPVMNNKRQKLGEGWKGVGSSWWQDWNCNETWRGLTRGRGRRWWVGTRWLSSSSFSCFSGRTWPFGNGTGVAFSSRSSGLSSSLSFSSSSGWEGSRNSTMSVSVPTCHSQWYVFTNTHTITHAQATLRRKWIFVFVFYVLLQATLRRRQCLQQEFCLLFKPSSAPSTTLVTGQLMMIMMKIM